MSEKLFFCCPWGKNIKSSWSGTHYSLFQALSNQFTLENIDIGPFSDWKTKQLCHIENTFRKMNPSIAYPGQFRRAYLNKKLRRKTEMNKSICFLFEECPDFVSSNSFIYQDISVNAILNIARHNENAFRYSNFKKYDKRILYKRAIIQNEFYESVKGIFTMGKWLAQSIVNENRIDSQKVHHVGGGINIDISRIDYSRKERRRFLFVGKDFERKNGPLVIEAFNRLNKKKDYELYIAGPLNLDKKYFSNENVKFLGQLTPDQLVEFFNLCDVFVMPSRFEAYGLVFAEALTFGLPAIGMDAFEMPFFIEDGKTGYLLKQQKAEELSELMLKAMNNDLMFQETRNRFSFYMEEYSWDTVAKRIKKYIEERSG